MDKIEDIDQRINNLRKQQETLKETVSGHGHNGTLKCFKCKLCDTKFTKSEELHNHLKTHPKAYECRQCNKKFDYSYRLEEHLVNVHKKEQLYKYNLCEARFLSKWRHDKQIASHENKEARMDHYYNNNKECPYFKNGCLFQHKEP